MPTPTGMLKAGDRIRHIESGEVCLVVERLGNDACYSVHIQIESGSVFPSTNSRRRIMTEAAYWLGHGWELVE